jgi:hypothetical protein
MILILAPNNSANVFEVENAHQLQMELEYGRFEQQAVQLHL